MSEGTSASGGDGTITGDGTVTGDGTSRDYSLTEPAPAAAVAGSPLQDGAPYIPNSSFSFQYTVDDSSRPAEKLEKLIICRNPAVRRF